MQKHSFFFASDPLVLHCFFAGERMHLVIGHSFQFTALPFGIATAPLEFVRVAPHSSVLRPQIRIPTLQTSHFQDFWVYNILYWLPKLK